MILLLLVALLLLLMASYYVARRGNSDVKSSTTAPTQPTPPSGAEKIEEIGFIVLRHVNDENSGQYWTHCYDCIRLHYPESYILFIDDNSNYEYIVERALYKTTVIKSEYPGRGELLPYYYYYHNRFFDTAVVIHDSVFINSYIDFRVDKYKIIWDFEHDSDQVDDETQLINAFGDPELLEFYRNKGLWKGCFGCMSIITHEYLSRMYQKYDLSLLLALVLSRYNRCSFERVLACLLQKEHKTDALLGNIHAYCTWGVRFVDKEQYSHLPMIKVWTGR